MTIQIITCTNILYKLDLKYFTLHVLYIVRLYDFSLKNMTNRRLYIINQLELYNFFSTCKLSCCFKAQTHLP